MNNPWKDISLSDYERHMALDSVQQLQAMNQMMKGQLNQYYIQSAMILGVAGGNGLEHVDTEKLNKVYGVDMKNNIRIYEIKSEYIKYLSNYQEHIFDQTDGKGNRKYIGIVLEVKGVKYFAPLSSYKG